LLGQLRAVHVDRTGVVVRQQIVQSFLFGVEEARAEGGGGGQRQQREQDDQRHQLVARPKQVFPGEAKEVLPPQRPGRVPRGKRGQHSR
jgi:hypothetical protein